MTKILYLEDEHFLGRIVKESLESRGYQMNLITDGALLMHQFMDFKPDICVLDVMVPHIDGFTLGKQIKKLDADMPIIYLTAKNQTKDILEGFQSGGNDYIKKPFSMEELIVRIENLLLIGNNRHAVIENKAIKIGSYTFHPLDFVLKHLDTTIDLSHRENELIQLLARYINQKIDRRMILKEIWGDDSIYNSRNLDVYMRKIRVYFELDPKIKLITLRGYGYHWSVDQSVE